MLADIKPLVLSRVWPHHVGQQRGISWLIDVDSTVCCLVILLHCNYLLTLANSPLGTDQRSVVSVVSLETVRRGVLLRVLKLTSSLLHLRPLLRIAGKWEKIPSVWGALCSYFISNKVYLPTKYILTIKHDITDITLWNDYFIIHQLKI